MLDEKKSACNPYPYSLNWLNAASKDNQALAFPQGVKRIAHPHCRVRNPKNWLTLRL
jgi:hypothetical protein